MGILLTVVLLVIGYMIVRFFYDWRKQNRQIAKEGGMRQKYNRLINLILRQDPDLKIIDESPSDITLNMSGSRGSVTFIITEAFGSVTIELFVQDYTSGKEDKTEWEFDTSVDQKTMFAHVKDSLETL